MIRTLVLAAALAVGVSVATPRAARAQDLPTLSQAQQDLIRDELARRGLTEQEARARLVKEGIVIEAIPIAELPAYKDRIIAILDKLMAEKKAAAAAVVMSAPGTAAPAPTPPTAATPIVGSDAATPTTTVAEAVADSKEKVSAQVGEPSDIYGHSLFVNKTLDVFRTTDGAKAPDTYILGAGDQVRVSIFGASQADLMLEVTADGFVQPAGVPKIFVQGLTLAQARPLLQSRLASFYTFNSDQFALTIQTARTVTVNIFGESKVNGSFTLSALNSAFNALAAAGGPTRIGSVRSIEVIRGNNRRRMDVYAFLSDPKTLFDYDLQQNDVLFVPLARTVVDVQGAVKRPMAYELLESEDLSVLIKYAGGINYNTNPDYVQVQRVEGDSVVLKEWKLSDVLSGATKVALRDGDIVRVRAIGRPLERFVDVTGAVFYSGRYDLGSNGTLADVFARAQLRPQAKTDLVFIERTQLDGTVKVLPIAWDDSVKAKVRLALEPKDRVVVFDKERYTDVANLSIEGSVRTPVSRSLAFGERIALRDVVTLAGGLQPTAADVGLVARTDLFNPERVTYLRVDVRRDSNFALGAGDRLMVYDRRTYTDVANLTVEGSVRSPVTRALEFGEKIPLRDALLMAGGLQPTAADAAFVMRTDLFNPVKVDYLRVDVRRDTNFVLGPGDRLAVYDRRTYTEVAQLTLGGAVKSPVSTQYDPKLTITDLVTMAGGYTRSASLNRVDVFRLNVNAKKGASFDRIPVQLDSLYRVVQAPAGFRLRPFDQVVVRDIPLFDVARTVQLSGQVMYPGMYSLSNNKVHLSDVVAQAGGLNELADPEYATLVRSAGGVGPIGIDLADALKYRHNLNLDPILMEGDVITVPRRSNMVTIRLRATRLGELASAGVTAAGVTEAGTLSFSYEGDRSANWYVKQFAGGYAQKADKWTLTVTDPNGRVRGTERMLLIFKNYPTVHQGSTISLRYKFEVPQEQKRKIDYEAIYTRTFQMITTVLTVIVLSKQL